MDAISSGTLHDFESIVDFLVILYTVEAHRSTRHKLRSGSRQRRRKVELYHFVLRPKEAVRMYHGTNGWLRMEVPMTQMRCKKKSFLAREPFARRLADLNVVLLISNTSK
jgi:hypothetical protein